MPRNSSFGFLIDLNQVAASIVERRKFFAVIVDGLLGKYDVELPEATKLCIDVNNFKRSKWYGISDQRFSQQRTVGEARRYRALAPSK
jgi:hypothetical protein